MKQILNEIQALLSKLTWKSTPAPASDIHGPSAFTGSNDEWEITVIDFSIEDQGFPEGSRGYDGAARKGTLVIRLTRELAQEAFETAKKQTSGV